MEKEKLGDVDVSWNIGMRRVNRIIEDEKANGYSAFASGMYTNLPDILVYDYDPAIVLERPIDHMVRVYEVTNYRSPDFYIAKSKAQRYLNTLLQFRCEKIVVVSFELNIPGGKDFFEQYGIEVQVRGYQD